jgi:hypothetical protein
MKKPLEIVRPLSLPQLPATLKLKPRKTRNSKTLRSPRSFEMKRRGKVINRRKLRKRRYSLQFLRHRRRKRRSKISLRQKCESKRIVKIKKEGKNKKDFNRAFKSIWHRFLKVSLLYLK